jgi:hypothetical protein
MIKIAIFLLISLSIILKTGWNTTECNIRSVIQVTYPIIWFEQTIDGASQNPFITRFFHNKLNIVGAQLSYCYLEKISPEFFFESTGIFGLCLLLYLIFTLADKKNWLPLLTFCFLPLLPFTSINLSTSIASAGMLAYLYKGSAIISLAKFLTKIEK